MNLKLIAGKLEQALPIVHGMKSTLLTLPRKIQIFRCEDTLQPSSQPDRRKI